MSFQPDGPQEPLSILVLHGVADLTRERLTTLRHLFAAQRYTHGHRFIYHYVGDPVTDILRSIPFDAVLLDTTFLCWRWLRPREAFFRLRHEYAWLRESGAFIAAFPQDDFDHSVYLDEWLTDLNTGVVFSAFSDRRDVLYPRLLAGGVPIVPALTGYIDEDDIALYSTQRVPFRRRPIEVGYRVRRLPANFGHFGVLKSEFGRAFAAAAHGRAVLDISDDPADALYGDSWPRFLGNTRFALASEGGSSVFDPTGEVKDRVETYVAEHPHASFREVAQSCLCAEDEALTFSTVSPRLFEIAMAGCCPILIDGAYNGLIKPEEHYIPVKRDFSNVDTSIERLSDLDAAEEMAARFEVVILENKALRYKNWIPSVMHTIERYRTRIRRAKLSEWEFAFRREQHQSTVRQRLVGQVNELNERLRILGNKAQLELSSLRANLSKLRGGS